MSLLAVRVGAGVLALLALLALRGKRSDYPAFVVLGLLYLPAPPPFHVHVAKCEQLLPTIQVLVLSLQNYAYVALFAGFYWLSWVQFQRADARVVWALLATLLVAALVEIAEGMTGGGRGQVHCRVRDLLPGDAGALGAALLLAVWARLRRKPAYVRLVRRHPAAAPPPSAPTSRAVVPPRGVVPPPPPRGLPGLYVPPPAPPDFSPGPSPVTPAADTAPTHEVAPKKASAARDAIVQRLQGILGRLREMLQRLWLTIPGRRRTIVVRVGIMATIEAQSPPRPATSRLDAPVLNAMVTVTNTRGETLFRARQPFYWHAPD